MEKHAYLIIAHGQIELLKTLIKCLDYQYNDIYIHLDKKWNNVDFDVLYGIAKKSKIYILENRIDVRWGTYSLIECELSLLKASCPKHYQYYHLMSGVDLPLKTQTEIHKYFNDRIGTEFVHFDAPKCDKKTYTRISKYHFFINRSRNILLKLIYILLVALQFGVDRGKKYNLTFQKGAQWFSITDKLAQYVLSQEAQIQKIFKYSYCADELFLQTIVANSSFLSKVAPNNFCDNYETIQYCIDWKRGTPYTFRTSDYQELMDSNMCFARKFDINVDLEIIHKIKEHVLGQTVKK